MFAMHHKNVSLSDNASIYFLMQFHAVLTMCQMNHFYQFDILRGNGNIHGMSTCCKADSMNFVEFSEEIMPNSF